jgi:hypothetical protein
MHSVIESYEQYKDHGGVKPLYTMAQYAVFSSAFYTNQLRHRKIQSVKLFRYLRQLVYIQLLILIKTDSLSEPKHYVLVGYIG